MKRIFSILSILCLALSAWNCEKEGNDVPPQPKFELLTPEIDFTGYKQTLAAKVKATGAWEALPANSWITISPDYFPNANEPMEVNVAVTVEANDTDQPRSGSVVFYMGENEVAELIVKQDIKDENDRPEEEFPITFAHIQWAANEAILVGEQFEAGAKCFASGITDVYTETTTGEGITCDIGYSLTDTDPSGDEWTWNPIAFNDVWDDKDYYYQGKIEDELPVGTYYYTFRFRNGDGPYKYAGTDGLWDGITHKNKSFTVSDPKEDDTDYSQFDITWAQLDNWTYQTLWEGKYIFQSIVELYAEGLTDGSEPMTDPKENLQCWIGCSSENTDPSTWTNWSSCYFKEDKGNNITYQGQISEGLELGQTYYYTFKLQLEDKEPVYAGTAGLWNGNDSTTKTFTVTE